MKKVVIVTQYFYPEFGACSKRMRIISEQLSKRGYDVIVLTNFPTYPSKAIYEEWESKAVEYEIVRLPNFDFDHKSGFAKRMLLFARTSFESLKWVKNNSTNINAVITTTPPVFSVYVGLYCKLKFKMKWFVDIRDLWADSIEAIVFKKKNLLTILLRKMEYWTYFKADKLIFNSFGIRDELAKYNSHVEKIFLPNGVLKSVIDQVPDTKQNTKNIKVVYSGNLGHAQGIDNFKSLMYKIEGSNVFFDIYGAGTLEDEISSAINENKIRNTVYKGSVNEQKLKQILPKYDIGLIFLADCNCFEKVIPSKLYDYFSFGLYTLGFCRGESKRVIEECGCGKVSENYSTDELYEYIQEYSQFDTQIKRALNIKARDYVKLKYVWEKNIVSLISALEEK